jgi:dimethylhistidine N-methyltransferase
MDDPKPRTLPPRREPAFLRLHLPGSEEVRNELVAGLRASNASIPPKYFYDALGSRLFEAICELPEYGLTRAEAEIFETHGAEIAAAVGPGCTLIDLGAGNCRKAERLFSLLKPAQYVAVDIAADFLHEQLRGLQERHLELEMVGLAQDFSSRLELPPVVRKERRLFFYPGSSIGNFAPDEAVAFLSQVRSHCGNDGMLLLGVDLVKDKAVLEAAYDDALGVTAAFNLNVLNHVNALIGTNFDVRDWRHVAFFNEIESRIEMHLEARMDVEVQILNQIRRFRSGERIHTENSYKATYRGYGATERAGFGCVVTRQDRIRGFAVHLVRRFASEVHVGPIATTNRRHLDC